MQECQYFLNACRENFMYQPRKKLVLPQQLSIFMLAENLFFENLVYLKKILWVFICSSFIYRVEFQFVSIFFLSNWILVFYKGTTKFHLNSFVNYPENSRLKLMNTFLGKSWKNLTIWSRKFVRTKKRRFSFLKGFPV